jgi:2-polyprenyl-3-methyl-5-hydroxy-6-metoxy-1,4-benzoquinol methylase
MFFDTASSPDDRLDGVSFDTSGRYVGQELDEGSFKTAISRRSMSKPARILRDKGLLKGEVLDYGCGKGKDVEALGCDGYDPTYAPDFPEGPYDTILCTYVLNVVSARAERDILKKVKGLLKPGGTAYFTVRRDIPEEGTPTQRFIRLDAPVWKETKSFCVYEVAA